MKRIIAYVLQEDIFFDHLTVRDQLTFTARLRLPESTDTKGAVERVINQLNLHSCLDTTLMLVSGGEKKRTNIGSELLTNPSALLLDEPTSGLDSTSATSLIKTLRSLASDKYRKTVVCSIHQPSSSVFYTFDSLFLLADGHPVFHGPPQTLMGHLGSLDLLQGVGEVNPADYVMDLITASPKDIEEENTPKNILIAAWNATQSNPVDVESGVEDSNFSEDNSSTSSNDQDESSPTNKGDDISQSKFPTTYATQLHVLTLRAWKHAKAVLFTTLNFVQCVLLAVLCGLLWFQTQPEEKYIFDRAGFIFFFMAFWFFSALFNGMMSFPTERRVLSKERAGGSYRLSAYFLAKTFSEMPLRLCMPLIYLTISYWMANLNNDPKAFFGMVGTELMATLAGESMGLWIGTTWMDFEKCLVIATIFALTLMLLGGFFIANIPSWLQPLSLISPFKYSYHGCLLFEFPDDVEIKCDGSDLIEKCQDDDVNFVTGKEVREFLGVQGSITFNITLLFGIFILFRIASYLSLRFLNHNRGRE